MSDRKVELIEINVLFAIYVFANRTNLFLK